MKTPYPRRYDLMMVIAHMGPGGSQRVASYLLNHWASQGKRICLVTLHENPPDAYSLDPAVDRVYLVGRQNARKSLTPIQRVLGFLRSSMLIRWPLGKAAFLFFFLAGKASLSDNSAINLYRLFFRVAARDTARRIQNLRSLFRINNPRVVLSFLGATNLQTIIAGHGILERLVISERNDPAMQQLAVPWEQLRKRLYKMADVVTGNTKGAIETMTTFVPPHKLFYVPNPILEPSPHKEVDGRRKVILTVGRLVEQKGLDVLIKALSHVSEEIPDWSVEIVGDGPLKDSLKAIASVKGVAGKVRFCGYQKNVEDYYRGASIFALPSRYEGTPNALIEAMTFGLPAIVSDGSPGPLELVNHGLNGLVFPSENEVELSRAILNLAENEEERIRMGLSSRRASQRFALATVIEEWNKILYGH